MFVVCVVFKLSVAQCTFLIDLSLAEPTDTLAQITPLPAPPQGWTSAVAIACYICQSQSIARFESSIRLHCVSESVLMVNTLIS